MEILWIGGSVQKKKLLLARRNLERETREELPKDKSVQISIKKNTPNFKKINEVMTIDENGRGFTKWKRFIADTLVNTFQQRRQTFVVTKERNVKSKYVNAETWSLRPCNKWEVDGSFFHHAKICPKEDWKNWWCFHDTACFLLDLNVLRKSEELFFSGN